VHAPQCLFPEADLRQADARGGHFDQSLWVGARLDDADLSDARLEQCVFHRARCRRTSFARSRLVYADFAYADLGEADLRGAFFERTQMHRALQSGTRWGERGGVLDSDPALFEAERFSAARQDRPQRAGRDGFGRPLPSTSDDLEDLAP
jgi:uncharacterized protein YjbI with pentapeptide repeats